MRTKNLHFSVRGRHHPNFSKLCDCFCTNAISLKRFGFNRLVKEVFAQLMVPVTVPPVDHAQGVIALTESLPGIIYNPGVCRSRPVWVLCASPRRVDGVIHVAQRIATRLPSGWQHVWRSGRACWDYLWQSMVRVICIQVAFCSCYSAKKMSRWHNGYEGA